jgi:succinoglycan biosynthesis transport protein ExoP
MSHRHHVDVDRRGQVRRHQSLENYLQIDLLRLWYWLRVKALWILAATALGAMAAFAYVSLATPRYTVTSEILVDPAGLQVVSDDLYGRNDQRDSQLLNVDGKLQTLLSRNVLMRVVERLDLANDPEFVPASGAASSGSGSRLDPSIIALTALSSRVTARRDERSFVITLTVWSRSVDKSIRLAEVVVEEFKADLIAADAEGAGRTAAALSSRLADLRADVTQAEEAVETFRRESGLRRSNGELISSRSMSQVDLQVREARERQIAAESRVRALTSGGNDSVAMQSTTLSALRTQYATLRQQADAQAMALGPRHPRRQAIELELRSLRGEIDAEVQRLVLAARNELEQARSVVTALEQEAATASTDAFTENESEIRLRELVREAAARSSIYETFLARSRVATERQELDSTNVRVISPPLAPSKRSWPPSPTQAVGFGGAVGFTLGALGVLAFGIASDMAADARRNNPRRRSSAQRTQSPASRAPKAHPAPARHPRPSSIGSLLNSDTRPASERTTARPLDDPYFRR